MALVALAQAKGLFCFALAQAKGLFFFYLHGGEEVGATRVLVVRQDIEELPD